MPTLSWQEKLNQQTLYQIGYQYLIENFHKFKEGNKIKVALEVISIFNKDGSKSNDGKQIIYVINADSESKRIGTRNTDSIEATIERDSLKVLPAPSTADNPQSEEQI